MFVTKRINTVYTESSTTTLLLVDVKERSTAIKEQTKFLGFHMFLFVHNKSEVDKS
jgi:hypothetical protein